MFLPGSWNLTEKNASRHRRDAEQTTELLKHVIRPENRLRCRRAQAAQLAMIAGSSIVYNEGAERDPAALSSRYNKGEQDRRTAGATEAPGLVDVCDPSAQTVRLNLFSIFAPLCPLRPRLRRQ